MFNVICLYEIAQNLVACQGVVFNKPCLHIHSFRSTIEATTKLASVQRGSPYGFFCFQIARGRARGGEPAMVLVQFQFRI